jgi:hypothetical protein
MRIAAVAFVLIVGAAVVLAFANTLNSWVIGGLLGGLAAILLSIPISLALFTLLARRQDARQRSTNESLDEEFDIDDGYHERMIYSAEGYLVPEAEDEDFADDLPRQAHLERRRLPASGYLALPPVAQSLVPYDDEDFDIYSQRDPRNYPRQPRNPVRSLELDQGAQVPQNQHQAPGGTRRDQSTRSLAQHQSAALRQASQEAQRQSASRRSDSLSRREQERHPRTTQRPGSTRHIRPQRPIDEYEARPTRNQSARSAWHEEAAPDDYAPHQSPEQYQHYPRRPGYPRSPRSERYVDPQNSFFEEDDQQDTPEARRLHRDPDRLSGNLRNPLVRRAPYLYNDDPLREELAQQFDPDHPIARRSSLYEHYADEE